MFRYVIFDLDGTLLDTLDDLTDAGNLVCRNHGWPTHSTEEFKFFVGNGIPKAVERFTPAEFRKPEILEHALTEFLHFYDAHKADKTAPYPGMAAALNRLRQADIKMAVLSNKAHELAGSVVEQYYPGMFRTVQGALAGFPTKPDPTLLKLLMDKMGAAQSATLFVGDSDVDIRTARNGCLTSCGVLWGFRNREILEKEKADYIVETPADMADLILM